MKKIFLMLFFSCGIFIFPQDENANVNEDSEVHIELLDSELHHIEDEINHDLSSLLHSGEHFKLINRVEKNGKVYLYLEKTKNILKINEGLFTSGISLEPNHVDPELSFTEIFPAETSLSPESEKGRDTQQHIPDSTKSTDSSKFVIESKHYVVFSSVSEKQAKMFSDRFENLFKLYNNYFRFDDNKLEDKMKVYLFPTKAEYESYLGMISNNEVKSHGNFSYIHYPSVKTSFLIGYQDELNNQSLSYQSSIQFIRSFIKNPPFWLRIGFGAYFQKITYNEQNIHFEENLDYLPYAKKLVLAHNEVSAKDIRVTKKSIVNEESYKDFYVKSWALVSFLLNSKDIYKRSMWDAIRFLTKENSETQNIDAVENSVFSWISESDFESDVKNYILNNLKTYNSVLESGRQNFTKKDYNNAIDNFNLATDFSSAKSDYKPDYYLGLISYEFKDYSKAENILMVALQKAKKGEDGKALQLIYYALGVNSYENGDFVKAKEYLQKVSDLGSPSDNNNLKLLKQKITFLI